MTSGGLVRLGIVGLGHWGDRLAGTVHRLDDVRLDWCYARTPERRETFAGRHECSASPSLEALLSEPELDGVLVATPHSTHADLVVAIAEAGKNIMVEKPMALTRADGARCIGAADAAGVILQVAHYRRRQPALRRIKAMIDDGRLGRLHFLEASFSRPFGPDPSRPWRDDEAEAPSGAMTALGVHMVDNLLYLGGPVSGVAAWNVEIDPSLPLADVTTVMLEFTGGPPGTLVTSLRMPTVITTAAFGDRQAVWAEEDGARFFTQKVGDSGRIEEEIAVIDGVADNLRHFAECIRTGNTPETDGRAGLEVVKVLEAIGESASRGGVPVGV